MSKWDHMAAGGMPTSWSWASAPHAPLRTADGPIRAWKNATWNNERKRFKPLHAFASYGRDERATCIHYGNHECHGDAPQLHCTCGFYGMKLPGLAVQRLRAYGSTFLVLEVNFSGVVIAHAKGYRAERQQVITVYAHHDGYTYSAGWGIERAIGIPVRPISIDTFAGVPD